ncbi:hypothetical protein TV39_07775 [Arthrobacter sp. SPG23]|uniref:hypothetical protein n=1 Tax=Arthrobacter sp. SPG23 TaxID=1610703 RepID=UPI0005BDA568|nr:hypothetical protein [Arthrobacter sp. SPG23]KIS27656.1 hypothetical protein TV39_07775 [Arthrobacter sp. SPG23]
MTELNNLSEAGRSVSRVGDASVDAALNRLTDIQGLPVDGHAEAYSALHDALLDALNDDDPSAEGDA